MALQCQVKSIKGFINRRDRWGRRVKPGDF